jgi:hypothetical protein
MPIGQKKPPLTFVGATGLLAGELDKILVTRLDESSYKSQ